MRSPYQPPEVSLSHAQCQYLLMLDLRIQDVHTLPTIVNLPHSMQIRVIMTNYIKLFFQVGFQFLHFCSFNQSVVYRTLAMCLDRERMREN